MGPSSSVAGVFLFVLVEFCLSGDFGGVKIVDFVDQVVGGHILGANLSADHAPLEQKIQIFRVVDFGAFSPSASHRLFQASNCACAPVAP